MSGKRIAATAQVIARREFSVSPLSKAIHPACCIAAAVKACNSDSWGEVVLPSSAPHIGTEWSGATSARPSRSLKHRPEGEIRRVPLEPRLVELLRHHLDTFGTSSDGHLFRAPRGGPLVPGSYQAIWRRARQHALTPAQAASPLGRRPYDLRHAAVSFWLNSGVPATQVAEWAGHSVAVLLTYYASCIHGQDHRPRIQAAREAAHGC